jgi:hypothetical protein
MDPTMRLYSLIDISRRKLMRGEAFVDIDKVLSAMEQAISDGANLSERFYDYMCDYGYNIPVIYAIGCYGVPIEVIKLLKSYWWEDRNDFKEEHDCKECDKKYGSRYISIKGNIDVYLNNKANENRNDEYMKELFNLFNVKKITNEKERHEFLSKYIKV